MRRTALLLVLCFVLEARQPVRTRRAMVVTGEPQATDAGVAVLRAGGNAIDAAVAIGFALGVTHSAMGGLGGGGLMVIRFADGRSTFIDFREQAPGKASRNMFVGDDGSVSNDSRTGWRSAAVPGEVRGLDLAHRKYGRKPWAELLRPAIELARNGYAISYGRAQSLKNTKSLERHAESRRIFLRDGRYFEPGELLKQPELAETLERIARGGAAEFYEGETARRLSAAARNEGGLFTFDDLKRYAAIERAPITGRYHGLEVITAAPSSAGGIGLIQMLGILEGTGFEKHGAGSAATIHWMAEAMRRVYADRSEHIGDPEFHRVPVARLLDPKHIASLRASIDPERATPSERIRPARFEAESSQTTHFEVVDAEGNAVSLTHTLNSSYGSGVTVAGLGFLLNNNMDNFAPKPGGPNQYGLIQGEANAIQPGKRPVSSMAPTILAKEGKLYMVVGTPGGPTIPNAVLQTIVNVVDFGMNAQEAVDSPRFHHQWLPDKISMERGFSPDTIALLRSRGHIVETRAASNDVLAIVVNADGWLEGAADSRREGKAAGW